MRSCLRAAAILGLLLGLLAGCAGEPERLTAKTLFPRVTKAEVEAGSSHIALKLTTPDGQGFRSYGQMKIGKRPRDTAMVMTVSDGGGAMGTVELRLVDRVFYISLGALTSNKFVKVDLADTSNPLAKQYGGIMENLDPGRQVQQYADAVTSFDSSGKPIEIDGVMARPYTVTIDPKKAAQLKNLESSTMPKRVTFTIYVGPDDLPRRMVSQVPAGSDLGNTRIQMDYSKWGDPVTIEAPSAANITTDNLLGSMTG